MMNDKKSITLCLALLTTIIEIGSCLQCYHCISTDDQYCLTNVLEMNSSNLLDCKSKESSNFLQLHMYSILPVHTLSKVHAAPRYCHKLVLKSGAVARTCMGGNINRNQTCHTLIEESKNSEPDQKILTCEACNEDKCNGDYKNGVDFQSFSGWLISLSLVIPIFSYKQ